MQQEQRVIEMTNVIGPIQMDDWYLLRGVKEDINDMTSRNAEKFNIALKKQREVYKDLLKQVTRKGE